MADQKSEESRKVGLTNRVGYKEYDKKREEQNEAKTIRRNACLRQTLPHETVV